METPEGKILTDLLFLFGWDRSGLTVIPSDYVFRLLECNQGCDLLKMILLIFIVLMRNGSLFHCSRGFQNFGMHFRPSRSLAGNSVNGERIMAN